MRKSEVLYRELAKEIEKLGKVGCEEAPDAFFIDEGDPNVRYKTKVAKEICSHCPIRLLCLEYALESKERHGIWGGMSVPERNVLKRKGYKVA